MFADRIAPYFQVDPGRWFFRGGQQFWQKHVQFIIMCAILQLIRDKALRKIY